MTDSAIFSLSHPLVQNYSEVIGHCSAKQAKMILPLMSLSLAVAAPNAPTLSTVHGCALLYQGHVCRSILLSGFEAGLGASQRADAVDAAATSATLLTDKSHWGIIRVEGEDRLRFLHSQGTNAFEGATKGGWER